MSKPFGHVAIGLAKGLDRPLSKPTENLVQHLIGLGAKLRMPGRNSSDVCLVRNVLLSDMVRQDAERSVFLLLDDDMCADPGHLVQLCDFSESKAAARSGVYCTEDRQLAASRYSDFVPSAVAKEDRWLTGLGCFAVKSEALINLTDQLPFVQQAAQSFWAFCTASANNGKWEGDDYSLCLRLGGVELCPDVPAGHVKPVPLWPDQKSLNLLKEGGRLPETPTNGKSQEAPANGHA